MENKLQQRCESKCELCASEEQLKVYEVPPKSKWNEENIDQVAVFFEERKLSKKTVDKMSKPPINVFQVGISFRKK